MKDFKPPQIKTDTCMIELTQSQEQALKLLDAGLNVFLTGKAGFC